MKTIEVRKELTDEWDKRGVQKGIEYAILTDEISKSWAGLTTKEYKNLKGLKKENLRDNMTNLELVLIFQKINVILFFQKKIIIKYIEMHIVGQILFN